MELLGLPQLEEVGFPQLTKGLETTAETHRAVGTTCRACRAMPPRTRVCTKYEEVL